MNLLLIENLKVYYPDPPTHPWSPKVFAASRVQNTLGESPGLRMPPPLPALSLHILKYKQVSDVQDGSFEIFHPKAWITEMCLKKYL
jgi:hypothetical protein